MKRMLSSKEYFLRKFKSEVRRIKKYCEKHKIALYSKDDNMPNDSVCILSENEYEIGEYAYNCSFECEEYFLTPQDFETYSNAIEEGEI